MKTLSNTATATASWACAQPFPDSKLNENVVINSLS